MKEYNTLQFNRTVVYLPKPPYIGSRFNSVSELKKVKDYQMLGQNLGLAAKWSKDTTMNRVFF